MRETDVVVVGAGSVGIDAALAAQAAGARVLLLDKQSPAPRVPKEIDARGDAMALDVILAESGEVAGLVVASQESWSVEPLRAKSVVLATGGIDALYPRGTHPLATGDGFAIAHRAGLELADFRARFAPAAQIVGGVACAADGMTRIGGLYVAGALAATRASGAKAAAAAARRAALGAARPFGPHATMPTVDSPLPRGFATLKLARLREILAQHFGQGGPHDADRGLLLLHRLKGEADEFARARVDVELLSFKNACEVALLLARSAAGAARAKGP